MLNEFSIMGRLLSDPSPCCARDAEITTDQKTTITLVVKGARKKDGTSSVDCIDIIFRSGAASVVSKNLRKGDKVLVKGRLRSRTRNGKRVVDIVGKKVIFIHLQDRHE